MTVFYLDFLKSAHIYNQVYDWLNRLAWRIMYYKPLTKLFKKSIWLSHVRKVLIWINLWELPFLK
jgi:hypothetical protein